MRLVILHTNDFHGALSPDKAEFIRRAKATVQGPCLYFDSGDCIRAGNLAVPVRPEEAWPLLGRAACDASIMGNRESHVLEAGLRAKLSGASHPVLCANMRTKDGRHPLPRTLEIESGGVRVGLVGVMVPMVTEGSLSAAASA